MHSHYPIHYRFSAPDNVTSVQPRRRHRLEVPMAVVAQRAQAPVPSDVFVATKGIRCPLTDAETEAIGRPPPYSEK